MARTLAALPGVFAAVRFARSHVHLRHHAVVGGMLASHVAEAVAALHTLGYADGLGRPPVHRFGQAVVVVTPRLAHVSSGPLRLNSVFQCPDQIVYLPQKAVQPFCSQASS